MKKTEGYWRKKFSSRKNPFDERMCYKCDESGHVVMYFPNKKKDKEGEEKKKTKFIKKKNGQASLVNGIRMQVLL